MAKTVEVPGFGSVEFPDAMDDNSISSAIQQNFFGGANANQVRGVQPPPALGPSPQAQLQGQEAAGPPGAGIAGVFALPGVELTEGAAPAPSPFGEYPAEDMGPPLSQPWERAKYAYQKTQETLAKPQQYISEKVKEVTGKGSEEWAAEALKAFTPAQTIVDSLTKAGLLPETEAGRVASAMHDEARKLGGRLGTDPVMLMVPASKAIGAFFLPGAIAGAGQSLGEAGRLYEEHGKFDEEVGRALVRGVGDTLLAGAIGKHLGGREAPPALEKTAKKPAETVPPPVAPEETVRLYRGEAAEGAPPGPEFYQYPESAKNTGLWFTDSLESAKEYSGGKLLYVDVPKSVAETMRRGPMPGNEAAGQYLVSGELRARAQPLVENAAETAAASAFAEVRAGKPVAEAEKTLAGLSEDVRHDAAQRLSARINGMDYVESLRERFGNVPPDDPRANVVETIPDVESGAKYGVQRDWEGREIPDTDPAKGFYWFVQRKDGEVVGGARAIGGFRAMIAGGPKIGSPVSARPIYEAMNVRGIMPSDNLSPYGAEAQAKQVRLLNERFAGPPESAAEAGARGAVPGAEAGVPPGAGAAAEGPPAIGAAPVAPEIPGRRFTFADDSRAFIKDYFATTVSAGLDPQLLYHYAKIGAEHLANGAYSFGVWSKRMVEEFGDRIKPYLRDVYSAAQKQLGTLAPEADPVRTVTNLLLEGKRARAKTVPLYKAERGKRAAELQQIADALPGEEGLVRAASVLKGALPKAEYAPRHALTQDQVDGLFNRIWAEPGMKVYTKLSASQALSNLLTGGRPPQPAELKMLAKVFGPELAQAAGAAAPHPILEMMNVARALLTSVDFSAVLRQAFIPTLAHPIMAAKAFPGSFKSMFSEKAYKAINEVLDRDPNNELADAAGLYRADLESFQAAEEVYRGAKLIRKYLPFVAGSERSYVGYLNKLRRDVFNEGARKLQGMNYTPEADFPHYEALARWINVASGRGELPEVLNRSGEFLSTVLFSPRLMAARLQVLDPRVKLLRELPPEVRTQAIRELGSAIGLTGLVVALAAANGAQVETDPRSSDFGKIKVGKTRIDPWGGFQQYVRTAAQIAAAERKTTTKGQVTPADPWDTFATFVRYKLAPGPGFIATLATQKEPGSQQPLSWSTVAKQLIPITVQDFASVYQEDPGLAAAMLIPLVLGVNLNVYQDLNQTPAQKAAQARLKMLLNREKKQEPGFLDSLKHRLIGPPGLEETPPPR